jgi:hypothetical protein
MNNDSIKAMGLLTQVTKGLLAQGAKSTASQLGDRSTYIGMSDIGKGAECLRAAVANKLGGLRQPLSTELNRWFEEQRFDEIRQILNKQLTLQRGHWFEGGIVRAFQANGAKLFTQLEIDTVADGVPVKAHLDMVLAWNSPKPVVRILELKSTEHLPENLYAAYEVQLYGQLGFLSQFWNTPSFGLRDQDGQILHSRLTFPELARRHLGIDMPADPAQVDIEGWVLALSMSEAKAFGPYKPDDTMYRYCLKTATAIWQNAEAVNAGKTDLQQLDYCKGFHPLCDWCGHKDDCPKFTAQELVGSPEYGDLIAEIEVLKQQKSETEARISEQEKRLTDFYRKACLDNGWLSTGGYRFRCSTVDGRKTLDQTALSAALVARIGETEAQNLITQCTRQGNPYSRLFISKNNPKEKVVSP